MNSIIKTIAALMLATVSIAHAENVTRFAGQSYIFAENGRLTFNIQHKTFINRGWRYNPQTDAAEASFKVSMPLKTQNASDFYGYEATLKNKFHTVAMQNRAVQWQDYRIQPVYQQKAFLPAAGWFIGVGGAVLRSVLPPVIAGIARSCARNAVNCAVGSGVIGSHLCALSLGAIPGVKLSLPFGICSKAEADGWVKDENGAYKKSGIYRFESYQPLAGVRDYVASERPSFLPDDLPSESDAKSVCDGLFNQRFPGKASTYESHLIRGKLGDLRIYFNCQYRGSSGNDYAHVVYKRMDNQNMTIVDLQNYAAADFKENPNDYINGGGPLGEAMLDSINVTEASIKNGSGQGTFSLYSSPYRTPNGNVVQDRVTIQSAQSESSPKPSGNRIRAVAAYPIPITTLP